jgi:simple sugar transport system permease protein
MNMFIDYLLTAVPLGMTFLYGCVGEILTEKVGHLNLGIPGIMCIGGATGCLTLSYLKDLPIPAFLVVILSILAAFIGGMIMGVIYCFLTVTLKSNQNVTGLAMTTFGVGTTKFIMSGLAVGGGMNYLYARDYFRYPFAYSNTSLKLCGVMVYLAVIIALISSYVLSKTRVGLHLRAVGENPATADAVGINVTKYKYVATCIGSGIAALGGLFYIMDYSGSYEAYKSIEALGWLAVALVIFTIWRPHISILGSIICGALYLAGSHLPTLLGIQLDMSMTPLLQLLPYIVTIIVLIVTSVRNKRENQPPASLGLAYFREER